VGGAYRPIGRGHARTLLDSVSLVDLSRATYPLNLVLRVAFAVVIIAALAVDAWTLGSVDSRSSIAAVFLVAVLGIGWACWPKATPVVAVAAALLSLVATAEAAGEGLRFAVFTEFVVLPVLFAAVLSSMRPWKSPIAVFVAGTALAVALRADDGPIRWIVAISMLVLLGAAGAAVVYVRLRDHERRTSVEVARQNERLDLARELHDVVGHHVTGIVVLAQASRFAAAGSGAGGASPDLDRTLAEIEAAGLETLTSVRRLVGLLRTDPSVSSGATLADVEQLVADLRRTHPDTDIVIDDVTRAEWVPSDLAATVHRLMQEATTNVRKHGDAAAPVSFELRRTAATVVLSVENGALGGSTGMGYGLIGMRERVEALGGTFTSGPYGHERWSVRATVPLIAIEHP
jgi:signal transduction histidine kinase